MKFRGLIIALVVLLALGGVLYWSNHRKPAEATSTASTPASPTIVKMDQSAVTALTLAKKGLEPVTLDKSSGDKWQITAPKELPADQDAVSGLLSSVSDLTADRVVEDKASDLKAYGLDTPSLTLDVEGKGGKERKILLGDDTPAGGDVYAMVAGDPRVFTIASYTKTSLDKGVNDLRDKRLITLEPDKVSRVELATRAPAIECARTKDGWQILKPKPARADAFAVDELVRNVAAAKMDLSSTGADTAAKDFAQASPVASVTLTGDRGAQTLEMRKKNDNYYAKSTAIEGIYKVDASVGSAVDKKLDDFQNKKLFDFGFEEPNKIELHQGSKSWFLTRSGSDWWSNGKKVDAGAVESLIGKLRDLTATGFPDSGFNPPELTAVVTSNDGKRVEKVEIAKAGDKAIARRENEPTLYQLDSSVISDIASAADAIKPAK